MYTFRPGKLTYLPKITESFKTKCETCYSLGQTDSLRWMGEV